MLTNNKDINSHIYYKLVQVEVKYATMMGESILTKCYKDTVAILFIIYVFLINIK